LTFCNGIVMALQHYLFEVAKYNNYYYNI